jgi:hypothetical protein
VASRAFSAVPKEIIPAKPSVSEAHEPDEPIDTHCGQSRAYNGAPFGHDGKLENPACRSTAPRIKPSALRAVRLKDFKPV